jgi:glycerol-3-phosphate dehydrogenase (NAD(P)+)
VKVAVMGAGTWGTTFGLVVCDSGHEVTLWSRRPELAAAINATRRNPDYLADVELPAALHAVSDPGEAMEGAYAVVLAVPSQLLRTTLAGWDLPRDARVVSLAKGIELGTGRRMSELVVEVAGVEPERLAVVTGPNLAREIAARQPSASVAASVLESTATDVQRLCHTPSFRVYTNGDVIGCELGGRRRT